MPNTTYYMKVVATNGYSNSTVRNDTINYLMIIWDSNKKPDNGSILGTAEASNEDPVPGTNQDDAAPISLDTQIRNAVSGGIGLWYAFTTETDEGIYRITTVNESTGTNYLTVYLYDESGNHLNTSHAGSDGTARTLDLNDLLPNTTYYMRVVATNGYSNSTVKNDTITFTLKVRAPETTMVP